MNQFINQLKGLEAKLETVRLSEEELESKVDFVFKLSKYFVGGFEDYVVNCVNRLFITMEGLDYLTDQVGFYFDFKESSFVMKPIRHKIHGKDLEVQLVVEFQEPDCNEFLLAPFTCNIVQVLKWGNEKTLTKITTPLDEENFIVKNRDTQRREVKKLFKTSQNFREVLNELERMWEDNQFEKVKQDLWVELYVKLDDVLSKIEKEVLTQYNHYLVKECNR